MTDQTTKEVRLVYVKWLDHYSLDTVNWIEMDDLDRLGEGGLEVSTVGFLIQETDQVYKLVMTCAENGKMAQSMVILKSATIEIKDINLKDS